MTRAAPGIGPLPNWLHDASIRIGTVQPTLAAESASGMLWKAAPGRFLLDVPGVARYLVEDGRSITIDPQRSASDGDVARLARATPFAALCHQRGLAVVHAAAAVRDERAVLIAGDSASGKSTLLAALLARGWRMLADDLTPVRLDGESMPIALPTFPELILWEDALERMGTAIARQTSLPPPVRSSPDGTWSLPTHTLMVPSPIRVHAVWRLSTHNGGRLEAEMIDGVRGFALLSSIAYSSRVARALLDPAIRFRVDCALVAHGALGALRRPRGRWCVDELAKSLT
jgi:hypothetical protein